MPQHLQIIIYYSIQAQTVAQGGISSHVGYGDKNSSHSCSIERKSKMISQWIFVP